MAYDLVNILTMSKVVTSGKYGTERLQDQREKLNMYEVHNTIRNVTEIRYRILKKPNISILKLLQQAKLSAPCPTCLTYFKNRQLIRVL